MIFAAAFAVLVLGGLETLWVVYLLAFLSSTALVFDAPRDATRSPSRWSAATSCRTPSR